MTEKKKNPPKTDVKNANDSGGGPRRRLLRSPKDRVLAGVGGGLGDYLGVDPTFVRLGFVAATLFGGFGLLAYLVMAVVVPEDDGSGNPVEGRRPPVWAIVGLAIAGLIILPGPFFGWGDGGGWWFGIGLFWTGVLLFAGAGLYRAIRGHWPWHGRGESASEAKTRVASGKAAGSAGGREGDGAAPRIVRLLAIGLLAVLALSVALSIAAVAAWATATGNGEAVAGIVIALGVSLAATAFFTDAARRTAPWLLALALTLAIPAGAVAAADVRFDGAIGERDYTPTSVGDIPDGGYDLGVGQLTIDLRELDWQRGTVVSLPAELGIGQLLISVPSDVCVTGHAKAKAGELLVRGEAVDGVDPEFDRGASAGDLPALALNADLQVGQIVVTDRDPDDWDHDGPGRRGDKNRDEIAAEPEACTA